LKEIERKFLVLPAVKQLFPKVKKFAIRQGYLQRSKEATVRVRVKDDKAFLTIKSATLNFTRDEFEYEIPLADAEKMLLLCGHHVLEKYRYEILFEGKIWEVDEFIGKLNGLYLAEIELKSEDETFVRPDWLGEEVSLDTRFANSNLVLVESFTDLNL